MNATDSKTQKEDFHHLLPIYLLVIFSPWTLVPSYNCHTNITLFKLLCRYNVEILHAHSSGFYLFSGLHLKQLRKTKIKILDHTHLLSISHLLIWLSPIDLSLLYTFTFTDLVIYQNVFNWQVCQLEVNILFLSNGSYSPRRTSMQTINGFTWGIFVFDTLSVNKVPSRACHERLWISYTNML